MSLFKVCSWWTIQCSDVQPNYDSYSLDCCRLGLSEKEKDYVVVCSHSGYLSIYRPTPIEKNSTEKEDEDFDIEGYKPTDLLLEIKLPHPIIGILCGRFLSTSSGRSQLAILHPLKLSIYSLQINEGIAEHGHHSKIDLCVEYKFAKFAFSFCKGSFGGVKGKEFLCIRHIDNLLSFFEQDGIAYECKLPGERNVPSIFVYVPRIDCFVTVSFECELECYRYQDLCQTAEDAQKEVEAVWSCCIGDYALDVSVQQITTEESVIMILGERNLIAFSDKGVLRFIKRLDYTPVCFHSFIIGWYWETNARLITAVVSDSSSLLVYEDSQLIWSAQLNNVPVAIRRSNIDGLIGAIVTLGPTGLVNIGYLGSDPNLFKVPPLNLQEINYEKAQKELAELEKEIQSGIDITDFSVAKKLAERDLQLKMTVDPNIIDCTFATKFISIDPDNAGLLKMCRIALTLKPVTNIEQIQVCFNVRSPLKCSKDVHVIKCIESDSFERIEVWIYIDTAISIATFKISAVVSFINKQSICRILETSCTLPLEMFLKKFQPQKDAAYKVTMNLDNINTNGNILSILPSTFRMDGNSQAIGLKHISSNTIVTIVAAKNSNRIRIQSDHLSALSSITELLIERFKNLKKYRDSSATSSVRQQHHDQEEYGNLTKINEEDDVKILIVPQIYTDEILKTFESHHNWREDYISKKKEIESLSAQIRLIQRRLLVKLDDKKAGATDNIMMLYQLTHNKITETLREVNKADNNLKKSQAELSCVIALTRIIVKHLNLSPTVIEGFCAILDHQVSDWLEQSWEEIMAPSMEMLTYIGPLRKHKHGALDDNPSFVIGALDLNRFKRHFSSLVERVCRLATAGVDDTSEISTNKKENVYSGVSIASGIQEEPEHLDDMEESDWINRNDPSDIIHLNDIIPNSEE